jgi:hypothetical protein
LTPRGLAYWIRDDGSLQNRGLHLNVYGFSYNEVVLLKHTLETLFKDIQMLLLNALFIIIKKVIDYIFEKLRKHDNSKKPPILVQA